MPLPGSLRSTGALSALSGDIGDTINALIAAIPVAQDGDVMTRNHHNSLRDAITALALTLDIQPARERTLTFIPALVPAGGGGRAWNQGIGYVDKPSGADNANGWMQITLPDGALLKTLTTVGSKQGNVGELSVQLARAALNSTTLTTLASMQLDAEPNSFRHTEPITTTVARVDNAAFKYLLSAEVVGADTTAATTVRLLAFQIVCEA